MNLFQDIDQARLAKIKKYQDGYEQLIQIIQERVEYYLSENPDLLMSYLYRMDIDEKALRQFENENNFELYSKYLAELILERQLERLKSKENFKQPPIEGWEW